MSASPVEFAANKARRLGAEGVVWLVVSGEVNVFVVDPATGARHALAEVGAGGVVVDLAWPAGSEVLAIAHPGTRAERLTPVEFLARGDAAELTSGWFRRLGIDPPADLSGWGPAQEQALAGFRARLDERAVRTSERIQRRRVLQDQRLAEGLQEIAGTLGGRGFGGAAAEGGDALLSCLRTLTRALGIASAEDFAPSEEEPLARVGQWARVSGFRTRQVTLAGDWFRADAGPLLAFHEGRPVALLRERGGYVGVDGNGHRLRIGRRLAKGFAPVALSLYRPLPARKLRLRDLLVFAWPGNTRDLVTVAAISIAAGLVGTLTPWLTGQIFDFVIPLADRDQMMTIAIALVAAAFGSTMFEVARGVSLLRIQSRLDFRAQAAVWDRLLKLPTTFFRRFSAGDLASRANAVSAVHQSFSQTSHTVLLGAPTALFNLIVMFRNDWMLSLVGVALAGSMVAFIVALNLGQLRYQRALLDVGGKLQALTFQLISGIAKLRTAGAENAAFAEWAKLFARQRKLGYAAGKWSVAGSSVLSGFSLFTSICVFVFVAWQMGDQVKRGESTHLTVGGFIAFNAAFGALVSALISLANASLSLVVMKPQLDRLQPILAEEPEADAARAHPGTLKGNLELQSIQFRYAPEGPLVLKNVSLRVEAGQFVAIVGPSGSGKSTLLRLLLGFEKPETGSVFYDGQDLQTLDPRAVREQVGTVLQSSRLMTGDVFRNIVGESTLTMDDAWRAAEACGLADDIRAMPMGMFTVVSEGGGGFSGGQKQRLMIARALARSPRLIFFDEATSALDNRTQAIVAESLERMNATRIVIAHRLSTIVKADRIVVMQDGRVVEDGTYDELMKREGVFHRLAARQLVAA